MAVDHDPKHNSKEFPFFTRDVDDFLVEDEPEEAQTRADETRRPVLVLPKLPSILKKR